MVGQHGFGVAHLGPCHGDLAKRMIMCQVLVPACVLSVIVPVCVMSLYVRVLCWNNHAVITCMNSWDLLQILTHYLTLSIIL